MHGRERFEGWELHKDVDWRGRAGMRVCVPNVQVRICGGAETAI